jgi:4-hydroxybenzoate polyprenyltransferase
MGLRAGLGAGVSARGACSESALLETRAAGAGGGLLLFVYQALHQLLAPDPRILLGIAPAAAWIAVRGSLDPRILWLTAAVTFWTAGFDIIYSCQDYEFDSNAGLFSLPRRFGMPGALWIARLLHIAMIACLGMLSISFGLGVLSWAGIAAIVLLLLYEHSLVRANDLSRVDAAFFTVNGYVSVLFFLFWAADMYFFGLRA